MIEPVVDDAKVPPLIGFAQMRQHGSNNMRIARRHFDGVWAKLGPPPHKPLMVKIPVGTKGYDVAVITGSAHMVIEDHKKTELRHLGCSGKS